MAVAAVRVDELILLGFSPITPMTDIIIDKKFNLTGCIKATSDQRGAQLVAD
jgi:hypothetical protein